jgi:hypothetical protein
MPLLFDVVDLANLELVVESFDGKSEGEGGVIIGALSWKKAPTRLKKATSNPIALSTNGCPLG